MRNLKSHLEYLELINIDNSGWHSTTYGINGPSLLSNLKHFDVTQCLPFDIMHSLFEGVTNVHLNLLFCHMINDCQYFDLSELNHAIKSHPYGYSETDTRPTAVDRESSSSFHLKQSGTYYVVVYLCMYMHTYIHTYCITEYDISIICSFTDDDIDVPSTFYNW